MDAGDSSSSSSSRGKGRGQWEWWPLGPGGGSVQAYAGLGM
jgi:hypothetical protein